MNVTCSSGKQIKPGAVIPRGAHLAQIIFQKHWHYVHEKGFHKGNFPDVDIL